MKLKIQSIRFSKDYFVSFEECAKWLEAHGIIIVTQVELESFFVYDQVSKEKIIEVSLQEYKLDAGVMAMVGIDNGEASASIESVIDPETNVIQDEMTQMKDQIVKFATDLQSLVSGLTATVSVAKKKEVKKSLDKNEENEQGVTFSVPIIKAMEDGDQKIVFGPVLIPLDSYESDGQQETYDAEAVEKACHYWMESWQAMTEMHDTELEDKQFSVLESYIAPVDFVINGHTVKEGTWLLMVRVVDEDLWEKVKNGELNAFSIGGVATATSLVTEDEV